MTNGVRVMGEEYGVPLGLSRGSPWVYLMAWTIATMPTRAKDDDMVDPNFWMTPDQVRQYLGGISLATLHRYRKMGLHPNYITPNTPRYAKDDVDAWVVARSQENKEGVGQ